MSQRASNRDKPWYPLEEVRGLAKAGKVRIHPKALQSAWDDFGWGMDDILEAMQSLRLTHFTKWEQHRHKADALVDYYKAPRLMGEDVYTHFYIDDDCGELIIDSFKRI